MWREFSDRIGATEPSDLAQIGHMSLELRNSLWNLLLRTVLDGSDEAVSRAVKKIWEHFFKWPVDTVLDYRSEWVASLRSVVFSQDFEWYDVYNLIEFAAQHLAGDRRFEVLANLMLERERSGYRFVDRKLVPVSDEEEIESIEASIAMTEDTGLFGARQHLRTAIELLAKKPEADYRNSIKESISAIESLVKQITGDDSAGLSSAIAELDAAVQFHGAFKAGVLSLSGYTSDEDGIRHAILEERDVGFDEAKFMLVVCTALVNLMVSKAAKHGLLGTET